jgi:hypothetical protein
MASSVTPNVLDSPALPLLLELEQQGCRVELTPHKLVVEPASRLTPHQRSAVLTHARELALLVGCLDPGVVERRDLFRRQLEVTPALRVPTFLFRPDVPYVRTACFSCGDSLPEARFSRCWRCSLAWRLACRLTVSTELAQAMDAARVA